MDWIKEVVVTPGFALGVGALFLVLIISYHVRQMALIKTGLIKKPLARVWMVDFDRLRSGLWRAALGGVIAATIRYDDFGGWLAFWTLVGLFGVGQVLASLLGRDRWRTKVRRVRHYD